ncbi:MAG: glycosyltransferase family 87 protein [Candidatus Binataceae bacterium]
MPADESKFLERGSHAIRKFIPSSRTMLIAAAIVLSIVAIVRTAHRLHESRHRWAAGNFAVYYAWGAMNEIGEPLWGPRAATGFVRPGLKRPKRCNYTPFFIECFRPFARFSQPAAFWMWEALQLLSLAAAIFLLARNTGPPLDCAATAIAIALAFIFRPLAVTIHYAQFSPFLLLSIAGSWASSRRGHPAWAGLWLAIATLLKLYPGAAGGYYLFTRRWREAGWAALFTIAGILATGPRDWFEMIRHGARYSFGLVSPLQINVRGAVYPAIVRITGAGGHFEAAALTGALTLAIGGILLAAAAFVTMRASGAANSQGLALALWIALGLEMSPVAWPDELPLALPIYLFAALIVGELYRRGHRATLSGWFIGGVALAGGIGIHDFTSILPGLHPRFLALILVYLGAAMILHARNLADRIAAAG